MDNPIVFIHGSGDSAHIWRYQLAHFGNRAFAIDLPGHGSRPDTLPEQPRVEDYARAVHEIITRELRLEAPIVAGHSLGGAIAITMGLEYAKELSGLILIGTGARLRVLPSLLESARTASEQVSLELKQMSISPHTDPGMPASLMEEDEQAARGRAMLYRDLAACDIFDYMKRLGDIRLPTLIMCGVDDRMTPVKYSEFLHKQIPGSMLRVVPDAGHYVLREQPEVVNGIIEGWLAGESSGTV